MHKQDRHQVPRVAPYDACVACFKGDTTTTVGFAGEPEFVIAAIHKSAAIPMWQAEALLRAHCEEEGSPKGKVPSLLTLGIRLCGDCARETDTPVGPVGGQVPWIVQPDDGPLVPDDAVVLLGLRELRAELEGQES